MAGRDNECALTGLIGFRTSPENWERAEWLEGLIPGTGRPMAGVGFECRDSHGEGPGGGKSLFSLCKTHTFS